MVSASIRAAQAFSSLQHFVHLYLHHLGAEIEICVCESTAEARLFLCLCKIPIMVCLIWLPVLPENKQLALNQNYIESFCKKGRFWWLTPDSQPRDWPRRVWKLLVMARNRLHHNPQSRSMPPEWWLSDCAGLFQLDSPTFKILKNIW